MKHIFFILLPLCISLSAIGQYFNYNADFAPLAQRSKDSLDAYYYPVLKSEFLNQGESFSEENVLALLVGQISSINYGGFYHVELDEVYYEHGGDYPADKVLLTATSDLEIDATNLALNYRLWKIYDTQHDSLQAETHKKRFDVIVSTILHTGDGSREYPYFIVSPYDAYILVKEHFQSDIVLDIRGQDNHGNNCLIYSLDTDENSEEPSTIYFNIDQAMKLNPNKHH